MQNADTSIAVDEWLNQEEMLPLIQLKGDVGRKRGILYLPMRGYPETEPALFYALNAFHVQAKFDGNLIDNCNGTYDLLYNARYHATDRFNFEADQGWTVPIQVPHTNYLVTIPDSWGQSLEDIGWGKSYDQKADWSLPEKRVTLLPDGSIIP